jgi:hypothetical protein
MTMLAMAAGAALILFAIAGRHPFDIPPHYTSILAGSGIAIILWAFGGDGNVKNSSFFLAGAAAVAFVLTGLLYYMDTHRLDLQSKSYLTGQIQGLPVELYQVTVKVGAYVPSVHSRDLKQLDFVVFKNSLDRAGPANIDIQKKVNGSIEDFAYIEIPQNCLVGFLGQDKPLLWKFDANNLSLKEVETGNIISAPSGSGVEVKSCKVAPLMASASQLPSLIATASAQDVPPKPVTIAEIDKALADLQSDDSDVRRGARLTLTQIQPEDVSHVLEQVRKILAEGQKIYRTKLGVSIALTDILRRDKSLRDRMKLSDDDLNMLLGFAGDEDRPLRIYSSEFLYDLESVRVAQLALPLAQNATNDDARYNWIFISQGGWLKATPEEKAVLLPTLEQLKLKTTALPETAKLLVPFQ